MIDQPSEGKWISPYTPLIWFAFGYGIIAFFAVLGMFENVTAAIAGFAVFEATAVLVAVWSVFGAGSYTVRLCWSHLIGLVVVGGFGAGYLVAANTATGLPPFWDSWAFLSKALMLGILTSLVAQIPFWFLRGVWGWQFIYRAQGSQPAFRLADIFVLTFLFALSFGAIQMAVSFESTEQALNEMTWVPTIVTESDPNFEQAISKQEEQENREFRQRIRNEVLMLAAGTATITFVISCLSVPVIWLMFKGRDEGSGCGMVVVYALGLFLFLMLIAAFPFGTGSGRGEGVVYLAIAVGCHAVALTLPLALVRTGGFQLRSRRTVTQST